MAGSKRRPSRALLVVMWLAMGIGVFMQAVTIGFYPRSASGTFAFVGDLSQKAAPKKSTLEVLREKVTEVHVEWVEPYGMAFLWGLITLQLLREMCCARNPSGGNDER